MPKCEHMTHNRNKGKIFVIANCPRFNSEHRLEIIDPSSPSPA